MELLINTKIIFCLIKVLLLHNFLNSGPILLIFISNSLACYILSESKEKLFQLVFPIFLSCMTDFRVCSHHNQGHVLIFPPFADSPQAAYPVKGPTLSPSYPRIGYFTLSCQSQLTGFNCLWSVKHGMRIH